MPDEQPDAVVAEHHHRADFDHMSSRDLATLWTAPIILTTAVQFFETLASNHPAALRKLHGLPGSVVFVDEAHAAVPTWRWMCELAEAWGCSFVLASGLLVRYWEIEDVVGDARTKLPELTPASLSAPLLEARQRQGRSDGCRLGPSAYFRDRLGPSAWFRDDVDKSASGSLRLPDDDLVGGVIRRHPTICRHPTIR